MKKILLLITLCVVAFFAYIYFLKPKPSVEYITQNATKGYLAKKVEANGEIFATELVDVGAQVGGQIKKLYVKLGDSVKQGDMIAEIDDKTQKNSVENKRAQLLIYESKLNSANVAYDIAKSQFDRQNELFKNNAISKQEMENSKNKFSVAKTSIDELKAQIAQAKISLNTAQIDLAYTKILAPRDGVIVSVLVEEGQTINANQSAPTIVYIADLSSVKLKMQIAEGDITKIKVGTKVEYSILSELDKKFKAVVDSIDPASTTLSDGRYSSKSSSQSSSAVYYYAQSIVSNKDGLLRIGMTTQNSLIIQEVNDAILVPSVSVKREAGRHFVEILNSDKSIEKVFVDIGLSDGINTQILSGIDENDEVITAKISGEEIQKMVQKARF